MKIKIKSKWIYPVLTKPLKNGEIVISDGKIIFLGEEDEFQETCEREISLQDHILMPGFINAHTHLELTSLRGKISNSLKFTDWIRSVISNTGDLLKDNKNISKSVKSGINRLIDSGVTTVFDTSSLGCSFGVLKESGLRSFVFHEVLGFLEEIAEDTMNRFFLKIREKETDLVKHGVSPHAVYSTSGRLIKMAHKASSLKHMPISMHISETREEVDFIKSFKGDFKDLLTEFGKLDAGFKAPECSIIEYINSLNSLKNLISVHCSFLNIKDIKLLKENNASVVFCPKSTKWFERKNVYPLNNFLKEALNVCIGTDSLASNDELNMFLEMREVSKSFKILPHSKIIEMATINGAKALSLSHVTGSIALGKKADIIAFLATGVEKVEDLTECIITNDKKVALNMVNGTILKSSIDQDSPPVLEVGHQN